MKMPDLQQGMRLLCIPFLLEGAAVTANARLRRDLRFGALAAADVLAECAFLVVALVAAVASDADLELAGGLARGLRCTRSRFCLPAEKLRSDFPLPPRRATWANLPQGSRRTHRRCAVL